MLATQVVYDHLVGVVKMVRSSPAPMKVSIGLDYVHGYVTDH